jgi:hypothetical protein
LASETPVTFITPVTLETPGTPGTSVTSESPVTPECQDSKTSQTTLQSNLIDIFIPFNSQMNLFKENIGYSYTITPCNEGIYCK